MVLGSVCEGKRAPAVTVFGWDDVLCPTTYARMEKSRRAAHAFGLAAARSKSNRKELLMVGASVVRCIQAAQRYGPVVVVTESDEHWVRGTAKLLLPGSSSSCLHDIEIVSSRGRFGEEFPEQPACWHIAAFSYVTNRYLLSESARAAVGLGTEEEGGVREDGVSAEAGDADAKRDGLPDTDGKDVGKDRRDETCGPATDVKSRRTQDDKASAEQGIGTLMAVATSPRTWQDKSATCTLREHHPNIVAKTVALIKSPTPLELRNQLDLLSENFELMFGHKPPRPRPAPVPPRIDCSPSSKTSSPLASRSSSKAVTLPFRKTKQVFPSGSGGFADKDAGEGYFDDFETPTTTSSTGRSFDDDSSSRYFDDNATVISSSSEKSGDEAGFDEEDMQLGTYGGSRRNGDDEPGQQDGSVCCAVLDG